MEDAFCVLQFFEKNIKMEDYKYKVSVADEVIVKKIYLIRGQKVMIDRDLAELYSVETKRLKEAVRRHRNRFPEDFMFEMTDKEFEEWRSIGTNSAADKQGLRYAPFCFTEQGVTMLSCILNSKRAIDVNIHIIRIFTKMREMLLSSTEILLRLEKIERKLIENDDQITILFTYLKKMLTEPNPPRKRIGFLAKDEPE